MTTAYVATKFFIPAPRPELVARERLHTRFKKGLTGKLTVVSAPAGFGKTTLVGGVARTLEPPAVWISLEHGDSDLLSFITVIIESIRRSVAEFGAAATSLLDATQPPSAEVLLVALINDLASVTSPLVLVLDDYHAVETSANNDALAFLLEHQPPCLHLIIVTREYPALPLSRLRVRGELEEFQAVDLRFTADEALAFFNHTMGLSLDNSQITQLEARTEGWVAGLQLAALSLQGRSDSSEFINRFTGSHRFVIDYLAEEVLGRLKEETRTFLLKCSVLTRFDASLCDAVTESGNGAAMLNSLERQNLFLIPLDEHRQWYRFHHLFVDVLHEHLRHSKLDTRELHRRASTWLQLNGRIKEGIDHSLQGEDFENVVTLIEGAWPELALREPESTFNGWMEALPESVIATSPYLCIWYGHSLLRLNPPLAAPWLETAGKLIDADSSAGNPGKLGAMPGLLATAWAHHAGIIGDMAGVVQHANRALVLLADDEPVSKGFAALLLGMVQWGNGDLQSAFLSMSEGHCAMKQAGDVSAEIRSATGLAYISIAQGKYKQATRICQHAVLTAQGCASAPQGLADIYVLQALLSVNELKLNKAQALLQQAGALADHVGMPEAAHFWYIVQSHIELIQDNYDAASDLLEEARAAKNPSPAPEFATVEAQQARLDILAGDLGAASRWASASELYVDDEPIFINEYGHLTLVRLILAQCRLDVDNNAVREALGLLSRLTEAAESAQRTGSLMDIRLMTGLCYQALGDDSAAALALQSAIRVPEARSQAFRLVMDGASMRKRLIMLMPSVNAPQWVMDVMQGANQEHLRKQTSQSLPKKGKQALLEPLSDREMDVLHQLGSELTGPQIASQLFVSLNTLRTHTKNIYSKLDVNNRRAAVRRASELGVA